MPFDADKLFTKVWDFISGRVPNALLSLASYIPGSSYLFALYDFSKSAPDLLSVASDFLNSIDYKDSKLTPLLASATSQAAALKAQAEATEAAATAATAAALQQARIVAAAKIGIKADSKDPPPTDTHTPTTISKTGTDTPKGAAAGK